MLLRRRKMATHLHPNKKNTIRKINTVQWDECLLTPKGATTNEPAMSAESYFTGCMGAGRQGRLGKIIILEF